MIVCVCVRLRNLAVGGAYRPAPPHPSFLFLILFQGGKSFGNWVVHGFKTSTVHTHMHTQRGSFLSGKNRVGRGWAGESRSMGLDNDSTQNILVLLCTEGRAVLMEPKADG